jgi:hypothetical protein
MKAIVDGQPVLVAGLPVQVYFNYGEKELDLLAGPTVCRAVECVIRPFPETRDAEPEPFATGAAYVSPQDNFNKAAGRLLAWRRATAAPRFTKDERKALWQWFMDTCSLPEKTSF